MTLCAALVLAAGLLVAHIGNRRGSERIFWCGWSVTVIGGAGVLYAILWWAAWGLLT